jgi:hypothetical protein
MPSLWQFGIVSGHLVYFSHFCVFGQRKIRQFFVPGFKNAAIECPSPKALQKQLHEIDFKRLFCALT